MKITYYGHACFSVETNGKHLLFDPFISQNPLAKAIDITKIKADYIFLSHAHGDHIADTLSIAHRTGATIVAMFEIVNWAEKNGCKAHPLGIGGIKIFDFGKVKMVNAVHSSVFPDGSNGGNPAGFLIMLNEDKTFYYSGDTGLTMDMQLIPLWSPKLDLAILPIGDNFTMGYEDAATAALWVKAKKVLGVHYDTFGYIKIDTDKAQQHFKQNDIELLLLKIGEQYEL